MLFNVMHSAVFQEITSLIAQEVANQILSQLPDVTDLDHDLFKVSPGFIPLSCKNIKGGAYKTLFESEIDFNLRHFFQLLVEQSVQDFAYLWLESMLKLQFGQILALPKSDQSGA